MSVHTDPVPRTLAAWTLDSICNLIRNGCFESERFDFKEGLPHTRDERGKARLVDIACAFANSGGGFIVFGVKDDRGLALQERLVGVDADSDLPEHFGSFAAKCEPSVSWQFRNPPVRLLVEQRVVHIVEIVSAASGPYSVCAPDGSRRFIKRTNRGNEPMSLGEIRAGFELARERQMRLVLMREELRALASMCENFKKNQNISVFSLDTSIIDAVLPSVVLTLGNNPKIFQRLHGLRALARFVNQATGTMVSDMIAKNVNIKQYSDKNKPGVDELCGQFALVANLLIDDIGALIDSEIP